MLKNFLPFIFELGLNNCHLEGGYLNDEYYLNSDILVEILYTIAMEGTKLMKLKLTNMNLRDDRIIYNICETIIYNKFMH
jgi:hypothetical protein